MPNTSQSPPVYLNGTLATGRADLGRRSGTRHHFRTSRIPSGETNEEAHVNGTTEEHQPPEQGASEPEVQRDTTILLDSALPSVERQLSVIDSLVADLNRQLDNLIRELDRLPVPINHARDDVWAARLTHEIMRSLARRMAVLLWFYHMGDAAELDQ